MLTNRKVARSRSADVEMLPSHDNAVTQNGSKSESKVHRSGSLGIWSSSKLLLTLVVGIMLGYSVLPMIMLERSSNSLSPPGSSFLKFQSDGNGERKLSAEERLVEDQKLLSTQSLPTITSPNVMKTTVLSDHRRKKIMVTGGAGFVGSHLVDKLMMEGHEVIVLDNFFTGQKKNIAHWLHHPNFK